MLFLVLIMATLFTTVHTNLTMVFIAIVKLLMENSIVYEDVSFMEIFTESYFLICGWCRLCCKDPRTHKHRPMQLIQKGNIKWVNYLLFLH